MTKIIRKLPEQRPRVESGAVQFGKEPPGIYLKSENVAYCVTVLSRATSNCPDSAGLLSAQLQGIIDLLQTAKSNQNKEVSLHTELTKVVVEEAIGVVDSVNVHLRDGKFTSTRDALNQQAAKIIQVLKHFEP